MANNIFKSILTLATGSISSSVIVAFSLPLLSRLYTPSEFGIFGIYLTIIGLVSLVGCGKLETALMLTSRENERMILLKTCNILAICTILIFALPLLLFHTQFANYLGTKSIIPVVLLLPGALLMCWYNIFTVNANSSRMYMAVSKGTFYRAIVLVVLQAIFSYVFYGANGLILGSILSYFLYVIYLVNVNNPQTRSNPPSISVRRMKYIFKKYRRTYMHLFPQSVLNHVSQQLPFLIFPIYYHSSILGGLFMAHRLLKMPAGVVTMALRNVFFPHFRDKDKSLLFYSYVKLTLGIFLTGLPFVVVFYFYINDLVIYILGDEWSESGTYSKYILIWVFMSIVNVATTPAFTIIAENKCLLQYECVDFIVKTSLILICVSKNIAAIDTIIYYVAACSLSYGLICLICAYRLSLHRAKVKLQFS